MYIHEEKRGTRASRGSLLKGGRWGLLNECVQRTYTERQSYRQKDGLPMRQGGLLTSEKKMMIWNGYRILVLQDEKRFVYWLCSNELTTRELIFNNSWKVSQVLRAVQTCNPGASGLRQEKHEIEASLVHTARPVSKQQLNWTNKRGG